MAKHNLKAEVTDTTDGGLRTITITVTGDEEVFQFADMLAQRKIIEPLTNVVKHAALEGASKYLQSAEIAISGVKKETIGAGGSVPKRSHKNKNEAPEKEIPAGVLNAKSERAKGGAASFAGD